MTAADIVKLLAAKHQEDVFVPECKDGPTWNSSHLRLDAWAMRKSWTNPCMWGYEVKVSRSDWMNDRKIPLYMPYCNQLYVVATKGVVNPEELPDGVGLILVNAGGTGLLTKRKAPFREVAPPVEMLLYILMNRVVVCRRGHGGDPAVATVAKWKEWLAEKEEKRAIGYNVAHALRQRFDREVEEVRRENARLKKQTEALADIERVLDKMDVRWRGWDRPEEIARRTAERVKGIDPRLVQSLRTLVQSAESTLSRLGSEAA